MTRPTDWDFSKISGGGETPARSRPLRGAMPAFASHIEERRPHVGEALPWAEIEFERISKSPRRAEAGVRPSAVATKRRFPRIRFRHVVQLPPFRLPRLALPRMTLPHMPRPAMPSISLPRLSLPRVTLPRVRMPRIERPAMPQIAMPRLSAPRLALQKVTMPRIALPQLPSPKPLGLMILRYWQGLMHRATELRAPARRGWRVAAFGFRFAAVAVIWLSAEFVYLVRLGYAHASLTLPRLAQEIRKWSADRLSDADLWSLVRQAATVVFFIAVGYGAAVIVGPVLKDGDARLAALSPSPAGAAASFDQAEPIASFDAEVPLPMPRIAHVSMEVRKKAPVVSARSAFAGEQNVARRLVPASQTHGDGARYASDLVSEIQIRLLRLGYPVGPPTGKQNAQTRRSILLYQRDAALPVSGRADMRLLRSLRDSEGHNMRFAGR